MLAAVIVSAIIVRVLPRAIPTPLVQIALGAVIAAVSDQEVPLDPEVFFGTSDIGSFFGSEYVGETPEQIAAQSPQAVAGQVRTPTLVMHSELDLRCPLSQAERYYSTLKLHGVETELVVFPGENHELSRSGRPRHRQQRFELILDWWQRHLPVG